MTINPNLARAAERLAAARAEWHGAKADAAQAARLAHEAGMTEVDIAAALGVDRARTLRRWLGK